MACIMYKSLRNKRALKVFRGSTKNHVKSSSNDSRTLPTDDLLVSLL